MTQWLLIVAFACLPPYINKVHVRKQMRRQRVVVRRNEIRRILNEFYQDKPHE